MSGASSPKLSANIDRALMNSGKHNGNTPLLSSPSQRRASFTNRTLSTFKFSAALEEAGKDYNDESNSFEQLRLKAKKFMNRSAFGKNYENILLGLSVVSSLQYIYQTYLDDSHEKERRLIFILNLIELLFAILFAFDWFLNFVLADHKLIFFTT